MFSVVFSVVSLCCFLRFVLCFGCASVVDRLLFGCVSVDFPGVFQLFSPDVFGRFSDAFSIVVRLRFGCFSVAFRLFVGFGCFQAFWNVFGRFLDVQG